MAACALTALLATPGSATTFNPIATTGHDQDVIVELGLTVGAQATTGEIGSRQFYENGLQASQPTNPRPGLTPSINGFVSPLTGNTVNYDFNPFNQNNILKFDTLQPATKTLTLTTPGLYTHLAVVFSGGSLGTAEQAILSYTINYSDGDTQVGSLRTSDWGNVTLAPGTVELGNFGRINMGVGTWNNQIPEGDTTPNRWSIHLSEIILSRNDVNVNNILFGPVYLNNVGTPLNAGDDVVVFGLAGAPVPEPSTAALAGLAALLMITRLRKVSR